jgi:uncharacterized protein (TIGR02147 family)
MEQIVEQKVEQYTDFRKYLRSELGERCARNPSYSLRAFAKQIGLSPSHLSRVLSGSKSLSQSAALRVASELNLNEKQTSYFFRLVSADKMDETEKRKALEKVALPVEQGIRMLDLERFQVISEWYHLPLYELVRARGFRSDPRWIAHRLGISVAEVRSSLDKLKSLGLLKTQDKKIEIAETGNVETTDEIASSAIRKHHSGMCEKAREAVKTQAVSQREFQSVHFAFQKSQMKKAKICKSI